MPSKRMFRQTALYPVQRSAYGRRRVRPAILRSAARHFRVVIGIVLAFFVAVGALSYWSHAAKRDKPAAPANASDRTAPT